MYLKYLYSICALLLLPLIGAHAQIKPGPTGVVCVIDDNVSAAALADQPGWTDPNVQGMLIRQTWASLEPAEGTYDFTLLDQACRLARQNHKFLGLTLGAGRLSPAWLYRAGARPLALSAADKTEPMPVPWDPIFQSAWASAIETLGNRYDTNPALAYVTASGAGRDYSSSLALTDADVDRFNEVDGAVFWKNAAGDIADLYATSFPHTKIILPLDAVIPDPSGQKMAAAVAEEQLQSHPGQLELTATSLATGLSSSIQNAPLGLQVDSLENLTSAFDAAPSSPAPSLLAYIEINSSLSPSEVQAILAQARKTESADSAKKVASLTQSSSSDSPDVATSAQKSNSKSSSTLSAAQEAALCVQISAAAQAAANSGQPIWLSAVANDTVGTGTQSDPLNVPTSDRLTAALFPLSNLQVHNLVFHFLPGTFYTTGNINGWAVSSGWQLLGSGQGSTILKIDNTTLDYIGTDQFAQAISVLCSNGTGNSVVQDMTLDGNASGCGSNLTDSFVMPAARGTVTVKVAASSQFKVGKCVYVQDSVPTAGINLYYGIMLVTAIPSSTRVTLRNLQVPTAGTVTGNLTSGSPVITGVSSLTNLDEGQTLTGPGIPSGAFILSAGAGVVTMNANVTATAKKAALTYAAVCLPGQNTWFCPPGNVAPKTVIPATAYVLDTVSSNGFQTCGNNVTVQNVTVQNLGRFFYEGPEGISILGGSTTQGSVVENCTVQNLWGVSGWIISIGSTNGVTLTGNTIVGDGYSQAYSLLGDNRAATISNNGCTNVNYGLFSDTGAKTNFTVTGNNFQAVYGIGLLGASFSQSTFSNNTIHLSGPVGGIGIWLVYTDLTNLTFSGNLISPGANVSSADGIYFAVNCLGSTGNFFTGNVIDSSLFNGAENSALGTQSDNVDQNGNEISLGLQE